MTLEKLSRSGKIKFSEFMRPQRLTTARNRKCSHLHCLGIWERNEQSEQESKQAGGGNLWKVLD